jgi:hypothetical protein
MIIDQYPMLNVLHSDEPVQDRSNKMMLYGQFVGSWEGHVKAHVPDGRQLDASCEIHFGWVLEGRAVQDVWIAPSRRDRQNSKNPTPYNLYGSTLRVYDPRNDLWHITWINPVTQAFNRMTGRKIGKDIIQEYVAEDGTRCQWCFTEITTKSFHWLSRESKDDGLTWTIKTEFFVQRKAAELRS